MVDNSYYSARMRKNSFVELILINGTLLARIYKIRIKEQLPKHFGREPRWICGVLFGNGRQCGMKILIIPQVTCLVHSDKTSVESYIIILSEIHFSCESPPPLLTAVLMHTVCLIMSVVNTSCSDDKVCQWSVSCGQEFLVEEVQPWGKKKNCNWIHTLSL